MDQWNVNKSNQIFTTLTAIVKFSKIIESSLKF